MQLTQTQVQEITRAIDSLFRFRNSIDLGTKTQPDWNGLNMHDDIDAMLTELTQIIRNATLSRSPDREQDS